MQKEMLALKTTLSELQAEQSITNERQNDYGDKGQAYSVRFLYSLAALGDPFPLTNIFLVPFYSPLRHWPGVVWISEAGARSPNLP
tara:strand:- start:838 stop:1095 length:258 start_codon:yes stop_codon:yes gene_type:complete